jgi:SAM-dependent methyltransferase
VVTSITPRPCPGCRGDSGTELGIANGFAVRTCAACGTVFTAELPAAQASSDYGLFYEEARSVAIPPFVLGRLEETVAEFARYRSGVNRWLDIGCGAGTLLRAVANQGWDGLGTEVAPAAVEAVNAAGLSAVLGETGDLDLEDGSFDVVSMVEVIEHVPDVEGLLGDAARLLRPGGALYLTTPHGRSISARVLGTRWSVITPPDHLQLFSVNGIRAALARAHLTSVSVATHGINPYELRAGLRSGRARGATQSNTETSYRLNEALSTRRSGTIVKNAANLLLSATRLGNTLKVVAERGTP